MIIKTDKRYKRRSKVWERGYIPDEKCVEVVRREIWWFLIIPVYIRETITRSTM
jgi:hypothetical protein